MSACQMQLRDHHHDDNKSRQPPPSTHVTSTFVPLPTRVLCPPAPPSRRCDQQVVSCHVTLTDLSGSEESGTGTTRVKRCCSSATLKNWPCFTWQSRHHTANRTRSVTPRSKRHATPQRDTASEMRHVKGLTSYKRPIPSGVWHRHKEPFMV
jgi:hypothetical protein